jgi:hypothetical protein
MFGLPVTPESIAVIRDNDEVFLSLHFSFGNPIIAEAWCQFLEGFLKAEAERTGWDCEKIAVEDYHGA